jgi:DHA2 family methylenomycin A resistance protein-like MFS transporter
MGMLIGLRAVLGVAGALLLPSSLAIVANSFPDPAQRAKALGNWAAITGLALVAGPPVGGVLTDTFGWRAIFLVNVPVAIVSIVIVTKRAARTVAKPGVELDVTGQLSAVIALAALTFALIRAQEAGWGATQVVIAFALFAVATASFVLTELRLERAGRKPMLPLSLFRNRTFSAALFAGLVVNFAIGGVLFTLSLFFQQGRGYSTLVAGLAFLPMTLPTAVNPIFTGRIVARIGPRKPALFGLLLLAAGTALQAFATSGSALSVVLSAVALLAVGFGVSYALPALVAGLLTTVPREAAGIASGGLNSARQTGAVLGVAILGAVLHSSGTIASGTRTAMLVSAVLILVGAAVVGTAIGRPARS